MKVPGIPYVQARNVYGTISPTGIAIHATANTATAKQEANYAARRTDTVSFHFAVDATQVVQCLDTEMWGGHAGSTTGNKRSIGIELCCKYPKPREWWLANIAWDLLGHVLAQVIRHHWPDGSFQVRRATVAEMKTDAAVKAFYSHDDMRQAWGGTTHTDPGPEFPWDRLFQAVNIALGERMDLTGWPLEGKNGHYMGDIAGDEKSHGGYYANERPWISAIQTALYVRGYPVEVTGEYRAPTINAVKAWQTATGRPVTGRITKEDWQALFTPTPPPKADPVVDYDEIGDLVYSETSRALADAAQTLAEAVAAKAQHPAVLKYTVTAVPAGDQ